MTVTTMERPALFNNAAADETTPVARARTALPLGFRFAMPSPDKESATLILAEARAIVAEALRENGIADGHTHISGAGIVDPVYFAPRRTGGLVACFDLESRATVPDALRDGVAASLRARYPQAAVRETLLENLSVSMVPGF